MKLFRKLRVACRDMYLFPPFTAAVLFAVLAAILFQQHTYSVIAHLILDLELVNTTFDIQLSRH
jgi:hypothetical protein